VPVSWLVKKQTGDTENVVTVGLFPQKQNDGDRQRPVGLKFTFGDRIDVQPCDLAEVEGMAERLPLSARIAHLVKHRPLSFAQIAETLGAKTDSVTKAFNRSRAFTRVQGTDGVLRIALATQRVA
jgi:hypothetical protein